MTKKYSENDIKDLSSPMAKIHFGDKVLVSVTQEKINQICQMYLLEPQFIPVNGPSDQSLHNDLDHDNHKDDGSRPRRMGLCNANFQKGKRIYSRRFRN